MKRTEEEVWADIERRFSTASGPVRYGNSTPLAPPPVGKLEPKISISIGKIERREDFCRPQSFATAGGTSAPILHVPARLRNIARDTAVRARRQFDRSLDSALRKGGAA